jgi:hypothetical protein
MSHEITQAIESQIRIEKKLDELMQLVLSMKTEVDAVSSESKKIVGSFETTISKLTTSLVNHQLVYNAVRIGRDTEKLGYAHQTLIKPSGELVRESTAKEPEPEPEPKPDVKTDVVDTLSPDEQLVLDYLTDHMKSGEHVVYLPSSKKRLNVNESYVLYAGVTDPNESLEGIFKVTKAIMKDCESGVANKTTKFMNLIIKKAREYKSSQ